MRSRLRLRPANVFHLHEKLFSGSVLLQSSILHFWNFLWPINTDTKVKTLNIFHKSVGYLVKRIEFFCFSFFDSWKENKNLLSFTVCRTISTIIILCLLETLVYLHLWSHQMMCPMHFSFRFGVKIAWFRKKFCMTFLVRTVNWLL